MPRKSNLLALAGFGLATAGAAWYAARNSRDGNRDSWYRDLAKPRFTPPDEYAFVPYAAWVAFAAVLNAEIIRLNPTLR
jgi:tryptophan-rich sensory protein